MWENKGKIRCLGCKVELQRAFDWLPKSTENIKQYVTDSWSHFLCYCDGTRVDSALYSPSHDLASANGKVQSRSSVFHWPLKSTKTFKQDSWTWTACLLIEQRKASSRKRKTCATFWATKANQHENRTSVAVVRPYAKAEVVHAGWIQSVYLKLWLLPSAFCLWKGSHCHLSASAGKLSQHRHVINMQTRSLMGTTKRSVYMAFIKGNN